jgi:hypothetical protein
MKKHNFYSDYINNNESLFNYLIWWEKIYQINTDLIKL